MQCPECKSKLTVRDTDDLSTIVIRVRRCPGCGCRIETLETITAMLRPAREIMAHCDSPQLSV